MPRRPFKCPARWQLRTRFRPALAVATAAAVALSALGCRESALAFGPDPAVAGAHADQFFGALAARYADARRDARYAEARQRLGGGALVPSRVFDDTLVWTLRPAPATRTLWVAGLTEGGQYHLEAWPRPVPTPTRLGDSRHQITLTHLQGDEYAWDTDVAIATGAIGADDVGALLASLWGAPERASEGEIRGDVRGAFPRAAAAIGRYVSIDTLRAVAGSDGSTITTAVFLTDPERLARTFPAFGAYLKKYANPMKLSLVAGDAIGIPWLEVTARDRRLTLRWRSQHGRLLPLAGVARRMPDTLRVAMDWTMKVGLFTVGVRRMAFDAVLTAEPHERAVTLVARKEPDWVLPLASGHLLRSSLRRPFAGPGIRFHLGLRDSAGASLLVRRAHLDVQESTILRFLGGLSSRAVGDLDDRVEREEDRFLHELFVALQGDARALLDGR